MESMVCTLEGRMTERAPTNPELLPAVAESDFAALLVAKHPMNHTQTSPVIGY